jgi:hypothetical protein
MCHQRIASSSFYFVYDPKTIPMLSKATGIPSGNLLSNSHIAPG